MSTNIIQIEKDVIEMQCKGIIDLFIYLDFTKNTIQLYCNNVLSEEKRVKLNLIKLAKKHKFIKSDKDFWKKIKDVTIKLNKEKTEYNLLYEFI